MSRWELKEETTPSERLLYRCSSCGRVSATPDKTCLSNGCGFASAEEWAKAEKKAYEDLQRTLSR